jgi:FkbM family methyltransferase
MRALLKSLLPKPVYNFMRDRRIQNNEQKYFSQGQKTVISGKYKIFAPENHLLVKLKDHQPYRDLCVGITAKYISSKYPDGTILDIGANIGDTAAMIATYAQNKLILVEASEYFFGFLVRNISQFRNEVIVKKALISDGSILSGYFYYRGGTASFGEEPEGKLKIKTERLKDIADEKTCFIKIDTDGYDFRILLDSIGWMASVHPAILFEDWIRNTEDLNCANELFVQLKNVGYVYFIIWDDPGFYLLSTTSLEVLKDLNRYLLKIAQNNGHKSIANYDVLCLHNQDQDVYKSICDWYRIY